MHADFLPHASVTVQVNNEALTEHHFETANASSGMTATTFIEATPGDHFAVQLHIDAGFAYRERGDSISFQVYVDGQQVRSRILRTELLPGKFWIDGLTETNNGVSTIRKLSFAEHTSTDGSVAPAVAKSLADLGEIKVELGRCRETGIVDAPTINFKGLDQDTVPEKALKGRSITSHTKLGIAEACPSIRWVDITRPYGKDPIATYIFQYRTRRDLEIEGIIERLPSPVPLTERDPEELTPDELREQNRLLRTERASAALVKREIKREKRTRERSITLSDGDNNEDDSDEGEITITSESDRRQKRARISAGAVATVDLTED